MNFNKKWVIWIVGGIGVAIVLWWLTRDQLKLAGPTAQVVATQPPPGQTKSDSSMSEQSNIVADHPNSTVPNGTNVSEQPNFYWGTMQPPEGFSPSGLQGFWTVNQGQWVWSPTTITGVPLSRTQPQLAPWLSNEGGFIHVKPGMTPPPGVAYIS